MSSSIFGVSSTSTRITGMMSGLDTDDFVKGMSGGLLSRITKLQQQKQLLTWKAQAYQGVSSKMINMSNTYMSYASNLNALSSSFYTSRSVESSSKAVTVSGYSSTADKLAITKIEKYAQNAGFTTNKPAADTAITLSGIEFGEKEVNNVAGGYITVNYAGEDLRINIDENAVCNTGAQVAQAIQDALANTTMANGTTLDTRVQVTYDASNKIVFNILDTAETDSFIINGGSDQMLNILGVTMDEFGSHIATGGTDIVGTFDATNLWSTITYNDTAKGKNITLTLNGVTKSIEMPEFDPTPLSGDAEGEYVKALQKAIDKAFGEGRVTVTMENFTPGTNPATGNDMFTGDIKLQTTLTDGTVDYSSVLTLNAGAGLVGPKSSTNFTSGVSNRLSLDQSIKNLNLATPPTAVGGEYKVDINGDIFTFSEEQTLRDILNEINTSDCGVKIEYMSTTNSFSVTATHDGAAGIVDIKDVGSSTLVASLFGAKSVVNGDGGYVVTEGQDAVIEISYDGINKTTLTRSTNTFDVDGLTITLNKNVTHNFDPVTGDGDITFTVSNNVDDVMDRIMTLIDAFNELNDLVNSEIRTKYDREYPPLTDEQRADMTESEIKAWEEKAMAGLLNNDPTLKALSQELRFIFSFSVPGVGAISDFGISVSGKYLDFGKVVVDEDVLRKALEERPDDVAALFTTAKASGAANGTSEQGIILRLKDVCDKYAATTGATKGSLITIAGVEGGSVLIQDKDIQIMRQIESIDKKLDRLQMNLTKQQDRYYRQFTALEVYIAKMNMQSSWLMDYYS